MYILLWMQFINYAEIKECKRINYKRFPQQQTFNCLNNLDSYMQITSHNDILRLQFVKEKLFITWILNFNIIIKISSCYTQILSCL